MRRTRPLPSNTAQSTVSRGVLGFASLPQPPRLSGTLSADGRRRATPRGQTKHQAGRAGGVPIRLEASLLPRVGGLGMSVGTGETGRQMTCRLAVAPIPLGVVPMLQAVCIA